MKDEIPAAILLFCSVIHLVSLSSICFSPLPPLPLYHLPHPLSSPPPPLLDLHHAALALQSLGAGLLPRALAVNVETHVPLLVQVEELLEELSYVVVGLG